VFAGPLPHPVALVLGLAPICHPGQWLASLVAPKATARICSLGDGGMMAPRTQ
jgi:hypothetical protein